MLRTRQSRLKVFSTLLQVDAIGRNPLSNVKETPESLHLEVSSPPSCSQLSEASCSLPAIKRGEIVVSGALADILQGNGNEDRAWDA